MSYNDWCTGAIERLMATWRPALCLMFSPPQQQHSPADTEARCRLRSASASSLIVRRTRLSSVGDRAFSGRRSSYLEQSSAAHHVSTVTGHLSQSPQDSYVQGLLSMTSPFSGRAREVTCHYGHVNRFCYLLTEALWIITGVPGLIPESRAALRPVWPGCCGQNSGPWQIMLSGISLKLLMYNSRLFQKWQTGR